MLLYTLSEAPLTINYTLYTIHFNKLKTGGVYSLFSYIPDEEAHREEGGDGANPEGGGICAAAQDSAGAFVLVVGLHIDDVVLADVIDRGVINTLGTGQVNTIGNLLVAFLTHDQQVGAPAVDLKVAGHGHCL